MAKLAGALLLAITAEIVGYFAPETLPWRAAGLALAAVAIGLSGFGVYREGLAALRQGRLSSNALMAMAVTVAAICLGAMLRVRPGERVPMDGVLRTASIRINQAPVTGKRMLVDSGVGETVFAGTLSTSGSFEFEVTALAKDSTWRAATCCPRANSTPSRRFGPRMARLP